MTKEELSTFVKNEWSTANNLKHSAEHRLHLLAQLSIALILSDKPAIQSTYDKYLAYTKDGPTNQ